MTRLTLFIDPGRIKRGVRPLEEIGPALEAGKRFVLMIDAEWKDAGGNALREPFRKAFSVGPVDREPPDPARWKIDAPKANTRVPCVVTFSEPIDRALAERLIQIVRGAHDGVAGRVAIDQQERRWTFIPDEPWKADSYAIVVQTTIEDLAGNNIGKPFEVDVVETTQPQLTHEFVRLPVDLR